MGSKQHNASDNKKQIPVFLRVLMIVLLILALGWGGLEGLKKFSPSRYYRLSEKVTELCSEQGFHLASFEAGDEFQSYSLAELLEDSRVELNDDLLLINQEHLIPSDREPEIVEYEDSTVYMNKNVPQAYWELKTAVHDKFAENLYIMSAYRTADEQADILAEGNEAATAIGASEHEWGLALDVYVMYHAGAGFLNHPAGVWVNQNAQDYGFIIRYPSYGVEQTGIQFEPWHLRYVGPVHAQIMTESRLTLEEYLASLQEGNFYQYENYLISKQAGTKFLLPQDYASLSISPDNMGSYILTIELALDER